MSEIHGAVGSYVVNALDPEERTSFEEHLRSCPTCSREVQEFGETAAELSRLTQTQPPPALRDAVLSGIRQVRPLPPLHPGAPNAEPDDAPQPVVAASPAPRTAHGYAVEAGNPVDEVAERRERRRRRVLSLAVAAVTLVAVTLGGWVVTLQQQQQTQSAQARLETQLLSAPDARVYTTTLAGGGQGSFIVSKSLNQAMFVGADVPDPGEQKVYKLWTIAGTQSPVPDASFDGGPARKVWLNGPVAAASHLAISIETNPDVRSPSGTPVVVAL